MSGPALTPEEHIDALNDRLRADEYYQQGMAFVAYPEGAVGDRIDGYSVIGSVHLLGVYARVAHEVAVKLGLK